MKKLTKNILLVLVFISAFLRAQETPLNFVNPFIGTGGHGHTFPGAVLPFGMVQLSPDTRVDGSWDGCGGYHYSDSAIFGFSHTHLSGTGISDWGDVLLMPSSSNPSFDNHTYSSRFIHAKEKASAGYYEVFLEDEQVKTELTATLRTGIHRYSFPKDAAPSIILDLLHRDKLLEGRIKIIDSCTVIGYRISEAWAKDQHCYFAIRFSRAIKKAGFQHNGANVSSSDTTKKGATEKAIFYFPVSANNLTVKVGISSVSTKGALNNLDKEAPHWDFDVYKNEAQKTWETQLKKVSVHTSDNNRKTVFYTALYHTFIHPSLNMDYDSQYRGRDNKIHSATNFTNYTVFSLWDTYRAAHPLFTILEQKRTASFIQTFLEQYKETGRLPVWELSGNETNCMIGYHSVSVIADALVKRTCAMDTGLVQKAILAAANYTGFGISTFHKKGFLSADDEPESVSKTLEYAYDDWCITQILKRSPGNKDYPFYTKSSQAYKNLFDPVSVFMRPRKNGNWLSPFDPKEVNNHYTEGNSWQYSFYAPHDIPSLVALHGGEKKFEAKLDSLFATGSKTTGRTQDDITGLIGQYAQGNEPSHHMAYLYNYVGKPYKTQKLLAQIMNNFYVNSPGGLIGNEDCGQMSAWYVFSSLGFYPVCPGSPEYVNGLPLFDSVTITLENGKLFRILANTKDGSTFVKSASLNGRPYNRSAIAHGQIMNGGTLSFTLSNTADTTGKYGKGFINQPNTRVPGLSIVTSPIIAGKSRIFTDRQQIEITNLNQSRDTIFFTADGTIPTRKSPLYKQSFTIDSSCVIKARAYNKDSSHVTEALFNKKPNSWKIELKSKYNKQYTAGGDEGLIDGIYGDVQWQKGEWQGYQYQDFECIIDLGKEQEIKSVGLDCLQDTRSWIIFPSSIEILVSADNAGFTKAGLITNPVSAKDYVIQTRTFHKELAKTKGRYVKIIAHNFGKLPEWHEGKGDGAFIFIDEIEIK